MERGRGGQEGGDREGERDGEREREAGREEGAFVCLSVPLLFFRHDRRTATKFGTHIRIDTGLALT